MNDNDNKRRAINRKDQGVGNVEDNATNVTLQASGTHAKHKNNSTCKDVKLVYLNKLPHIWIFLLFFLL